MSVMFNGRVLMRGKAVLGTAVIVAIACASPSSAARQTTDTIAIRDHRLSLRLYGRPGADPVILSSGDGGWIHLAPHVAETLAANGFFVIGFDSRAYLASFTSGAVTLRPDDVVGDYPGLVRYASRLSRAKPILIGISEGAGLSVLAATGPETRRSIGGVIALGLSDLNELGWRWRDAQIYLTHGVPDEPTFSAAALAASVSPVPLAAIHATHDEFGTLEEAQRTMQQAKEPKKLWVVNASNHRFSDNLPEFDTRLLESIAWIRQQGR
jgi:alpha-beta hydrolase superfamily lysophospholipase